VDKRYQVFISSTFTDLVEERQAVLRAILELDQMPAGMELFPASDDSAWDLIKDVIEASDYYVVVVGGRYGSLDEAGIGYTEREYDYAAELGRPVIPLLHKHPEKISRDQTETDADAWAKLRAFRAKLELAHTCSYWTNSEELKAKAIVGLTAATKRHPAVGWVRADQIPTGATISEVLALRDRVAELEAQISATRLAPPPGAEDLMQGDDHVTVDVGFLAQDPGSAYGGARYTAAIVVTWNEVFAAIAPTMIDEASNAALGAAFARFFTERVRQVFGDDEDVKGKQLKDVSYPNSQREDFVVQFRALGLMRESSRPRSVKDTQTHWTLTPYGDNLMTRLRAARRPPVESETDPPAGGEVSRRRPRRRTSPPAS
jgi:Domain of unknown function (DUF4062)